MARDTKLYFKLEENIKEQFQELATLQGTNISALAAHIIGQYVYSQKIMMDRVADVVEDMIGQDIEDMLKDRDEMKAKIDLILDKLGGNPPSSPTKASAGEQEGGN